MKQGQFDVDLFLSKVGQGRVIKDYQWKATIFSEGEPADALFYVISGRVRLIVVSERGKLAEIGMLKAGDFFGEDCLIGDLKRVSTAQGWPECSVMRLESKPVAKVLREELSFAALFIHYLLQRNVDIQDALEMQLFNHTEVRLARILLLWADFDKPQPRAPLKREFTQDELAEIAGCERETVSRIMNDFRDKNFIEYNGGLVVHASLLNVVLQG
jgi:CRP/FNR family transcriptional regulator, cyclic AMP receptor protein